MRDSKAKQLREFARESRLDAEQILKTMTGTGERKLTYCLPLGKDELAEYEMHADEKGRITSAYYLDPKHNEAL